MILERLVQIEQKGGHDSNRYVEGCTTSEHYWVMHESHQNKTKLVTRQWLY